MVYIKKDYDFLFLPNIICFQIERFSDDLKQQKNNTLIDFPITGLNLNHFLSKKNSIRVQKGGLFDLLGIIEHRYYKGRQHYLCYLRDPKTQKFYKFDDEAIEEIPETQLVQIVPYMLFYQQQIDNDIQVRHNVKSQVKLMEKKEIVVNKEQCAWLPNFWFEKFITLRNPGMLVTNYLKCIHGVLKPDYYDCFPLKGDTSNQSLSPYLQAQLADTSMIEQSFIQDKNEDSQQQDFQQFQFNQENLFRQSTLIPIEFASYIQEKYGGDKAIEYGIQSCQKCLLESKFIKDRKNLEKKIIQKYEKIDSEAKYLIILNWFNEWKNYLYQSKKVFKGNFIKGYPFPNKINNHDLLIEGKDSLKEGLIEGTHYILVNSFLWNILSKLHQGGPMIKLINKQIQIERKLKYEVEFTKEDYELFFSIQKLNQLIFSQNFRDVQIITKEQVFEPLTQQSNVCKDSILQEITKQEKEEQLKLSAKQVQLAEIEQQVTFKAPDNPLEEIKQLQEQQQQQQEQQYETPMKNLQTEIQMERYHKEANQNDEQKIVEFNAGKTESQGEVKTPELKPIETDEKENLQNIGQLDNQEESTTVFNESDQHNQQDQSEQQQS